MSWLTVGHSWYWFFVILLLLGMCIVLIHREPIKQLMGLGIMQTAVFLLYIMLAFIHDSMPPILQSNTTLHANPLPHVLILTAIVVAVATLALGLSMLHRLIKTGHEGMDFDDQEDHHTP